MKEKDLNPEESIERSSRLSASAEGRDFETEVAEFKTRYGTHAAEMLRGYRWLYDGNMPESTEGDKASYLQIKNRIEAACSSHGDEFMAILLKFGLHGEADELVIRFDELCDLLLELRAHYEDKFIDILFFPGLLRFGFSIFSESIERAKEWHEKLLPYVDNLREEQLRALASVKMLYDPYEPGVNGILFDAAISDDSRVWGMAEVILKCSSPYRGGLSREAVLRLSEDEIALFEEYERRERAAHPDCPHEDDLSELLAETRALNKGNKYEGIQGEIESRMEALKLDFDFNGVLSAEASENDMAIRLELAEVYGAEYVSAFHCGLAYVKKDDRYFFVDESGGRIDDRVYDHVENFSDGFALVKVGEYFFYIDPQGNRVFDRYFSNAKSFSEGLASVKIIMNTQADVDLRDYNYINKKGELEINKRYAYATSFVNGLAMVDQDYGTMDGDTAYTGEIEVINRKGEKIASSPVGSDCSTSQFFIREDHALSGSPSALIEIAETWGEQNSQVLIGGEQVPTDLDIYSYGVLGFDAESYTSKNGLFNVKRVSEESDCWRSYYHKIVINESGEMAIDARFDEIKGFYEEGVAFVKYHDPKDQRDKPYYLINTDGELVCTTAFDDVLRGFEDGAAHVVLNGEAIYVDAQGEQIYF